MPQNKNAYNNAYEKKHSLVSPCETNRYTLKDSDPNIKSPPHEDHGTTICNSIYTTKNLNNVQPLVIQTDMQRKAREQLYAVSIIRQNKNYDLNWAWSKKYLIHI